MRGFVGIGMEVGGVGGPGRQVHRGLRRTDLRRGPRTIRSHLDREGATVNGPRNGGRLRWWTIGQRIPGWGDSVRRPAKPYVSVVTTCGRDLARDHEVHGWTPT